MFILILYEEEGFNKLLYIRYEFLTTVNVKAVDVWDTTTFILVEIYQFLE